MINLLKVFLILLALSSCCEKYKNKYVISSSAFLPKSIYEIKNRRLQPPPLFYGDLNFMFDSSKLVYVYRRRILIGCGNDVDHSKPKFIGLEPREISAIAIDTLDQFLESLHLGSSLDREKFVISSPKDTVYAKEFDLLMNYIENQKRPVVYWIRKHTEEESVVLEHFKLNKPYDPQSIKWETAFRNHIVTSHRYKEGLPITVLP